MRELIDECLEERRDKILEKYINTIHNRKLQESYKGGAKPNPGAISLECTRNFDGERRRYMHGKTVESALRGKLQAELGQNIDFCKISDHIASDILVGFADIIWREDA
ncbi:hypothetical protein D3C78_1440750 [compost metagenome]